MSAPRPSAARAAVRLFSTLAFATLAAWLLGRLASDRWLWSQYISWVPQELYLAVAAACVLLAALGALAGDRTVRGSRQLRLAAAALVLASAHLALIHWRLTNALGSRPPGALRILNWNTTAVERDEQIAQPLHDLAPDVAVLVNPMSNVHWHQVFEGFPDPKAVIWDGGFIILSHIHIIRHGIATLGIRGAISEGWNNTRHLDTGRALYFELDTTRELGRTTVVWVVDLPSDWHKSRWDMAAAAAAAIASWPGPEILHNHDGTTYAGPVRTGFPAPDIVLGDFNSPRGSASQRLIVRDMADAYDQAGYGYAATWPDYGFHMPFPVLHLDHIFLAPWLRSTRYDIIKPPMCYHRPQVAEVLRDDKMTK